MIKNSAVYRIVLILITLATFLNLFVPRYATEAESAVRLPVQIVSGLTLLALVPFSLFYRSICFSSFTKLLYSFIVIVIVYTLLGVLGGGIPNSIIFSMFRLLSWLLAILFFLKNFSFEENESNRLIRIYIVLFVVVAAKKIFETSIFDVDKLDGGDIAGLTLVLAVPSVFMFFNNTWKILLTAAIIMLILVTLRRTAILALLLSSPFLFREIKQRLKAIHVVLFCIVASIAIFYTWEFLGDAIYYRFEDLLVGDGGGGKDSYGSGRSIFYAIVFDSWYSGNTFSVIFGNGIGSVAELLRIKYEDIGHVHNDFLEVLYTFGLLGALLWVSIMYKLLSFIKYVRRYYHEGLNVYYSAIVSFFIVSLTSGTLFKIEMLIFSLPLALIIKRTERAMLKAQMSL